MNETAISLAQRVDPDVKALGVESSSLAKGSIWHDIFSGPRTIWLTGAINAWANISNLLPDFSSAIGRYLRSIELAIFKGEECVLYHFNIRDENYLYVGLLPEPIEIIQSKYKFSDALKYFYSQMHNGFFYQPSMALGPLPLNRIFNLSQKEWGWMDELDWQAPVDLNNYIVVFSNGGGGYICIPHDTCSINDNELVGYAWWSDEPPDTEKFWPLLDAWMFSGLVEE